MRAWLERVVIRMHLRAILWMGVAGVLGLLSSGCRTYKTQASSMTAAWAMGQPEQAAREFTKRAEQKAGSIDSVIWELEAGAAWRAAGSFPNSLNHLDAAAGRIEAYEQKAKVRVSSEVLAMMSNQQNLPYEGRSYDKIMLHTYRALDYLALGEVEKARPALVKAYQCQQDAVEENAKRIAQAREAVQGSKDRERVERAQADPRLAGELQQLTRGFEGFKAYADYVNPFTVYLDGLFFFHAGGGSSDRERSIKSFRRVLEVAGANKHVEADARMAESALGGGAPGPLTYVIFETGRAASRGQIRIDVPIIFTRLSYVGAAWPTLEFHPDYAPSLTVTGGGVTEATLPVADMDAIIALDFKNELPIITTKTLISTLAKGAANYAINQAADQADSAVGLLARIVTAATQAAVNIADTRSWNTLPKQFQVARLPTPADRRVVLVAPNGARAEVALIDGQVNVIYAKIIGLGGPLLTHQFKLK